METMLRWLAAVKAARGETESGTLPRFSQNHRRLALAPRADPPGDVGLDRPLMSRSILQTMHPDLPLVSAA